MPMHVQYYSTLPLFKLITKYKTKLKQKFRPIGHTMMLGHHT